MKKLYDFLDIITQKIGCVVYICSLAVPFVLPFIFYEDKFKLFIVSCLLIICYINFLLNKNK